MRTLRLLLWLRWRIGMNTTSTRSRWATVGLSLLIALAMSPIYVGGAIGAYALTVKIGAAGLPVVFGLCQLTVFWVSLLIGAMGRTFELDKLKRYPLRARDVFAINTLAALFEPIVVMTMPALVTAAIGVARHSGTPAGLAAAAAGALLLLVTVSLLQLLLAFIDDLLRREWMRYVAAFFFTMTMIGFQLTLRSSSAKFAEQARKAGFTPEQLLDRVRQAFERVPTVAAPVSVAGAHPAGWLAAPPAGLAACAAFILVPLLVGGRVMSRASLRAAPGGVLRARGPGSARGSLGLPLPGLSHPQSLLVAREFLYMVRTPALLYQLAVVALSSVALIFLSTRNTAYGAFTPMLVMLGTLAGRNLMLWGYDGAGIRTLFLLPVSARDLVLTKNVAWLATALLEAIVVFGLLAIFRSASVLPWLAVVATGWLALVLLGGVLGTYVSVRFPTRPPERGLGRRSPGGPAALGALLAMLAIGAALVVLVIAVRRLTPDAYDGVASLIVTALAVCIAAGIWWIGLERNADLLELGREKMIDTLAKSSDA